MVADSIPRSMPRPDPVAGERPGARGRWHPLVLVPLLLTAWVYRPITHVNFFADDFVHFASIESDGYLDFLLAPFGGHNYLVRNLFFIAAWKLFGLRASLYYAVALLTHLLNVALLFGLLRTVTTSVALACFGAALWGTSPLCLGTIGWFSVYGQVMLGTILLLVLGGVARAAASGETSSSHTMALWYALLLAGTTCFGIGVGIALVFPVVLFLFLPAAWARPRVRAAWLLLPVLTLGLYFAFRRLYLLVGTLTVQEALQTYLVPSGLGSLAPMLGSLLTFSAAGAALGFFMPAAYPSSASLAAAMAVAGGLGLIAVRGDAQTRRIAAAMVVLALGVYGMIAAGRSGAYAMFNIGPWAAARVARYHYVGSVPMIVLVCLILRELGRLPLLHAVPAPLALAGGLAIVVYGILRVGVRVEEYRWTADYIRRTAFGIASEVQAQPPGSTVYLENGTTPLPIRGPALPNFLFPGRAGVFILLNRSDQMDGRTVRFVERDDETLEFYAARPYTRLAQLIVRPDQTPVAP